MRVLLTRLIRDFFPWIEVRRLRAELDRVTRALHHAEDEIDMLRHAIGSQEVPL
jgi:hypothetical protein